MFSPDAESAALQDAIERLLALLQVTSPPVKRTRKGKVDICAVDVNVAPFDCIVVGRRLSVKESGVGGKL